MIIFYHDLILITFHEFVKNIHFQGLIIEFHVAFVFLLLESISFKED
jgi:hypothetical protein